MTPIKTVKEGLLLVLFIVIGVFSFDYVLESKAGKIFSAYSTFEFLALKWKIVALISSATATYYYVIKNFWINFKSRNVTTLLIIVAAILAYTSASLYIAATELKTVIEVEFNKISFPIESDFVTKNIKISMLKFTSYMLISAFITGVTAFVTGNVYLLIYRRRFHK